jgi:DNA-binding CsgD family transcriptional regulator
MTGQASELLEGAMDAFGRGDLPTAASLLEGCVEAGGPPVAHLLLAGLAYGDDRLEDTRVEYEHAFRGFDATGDRCGAARAAMLLAELHWGSLGNPAAGRGWLERSRRLLDLVGPCVEWGYWELARLACDRPDVDDLTRSAASALEIATEYGDRALEVRALADGGLALVTQGHVRRGFEQLDEALALLSTGDIHDPYVVGTALCSLLSSCDRAGDVERATEWIRLTRLLVLDPMGDRPRVLSTHCKIAFGSVLCSAGRWHEAEATILAALGPEASVCVGHRVEATAMLAELRVQQGRIEEAAELLSPIEDAVSAAGPLAQVHLQRGQPDLAAAVLGQAITQLVGDVLRGGPLVATLVEAQLARGDIPAATDAARLLRSMSAVVDTPVILALAALADGRIALASGRPAEAVSAFDTALGHLARGDRPLLAATIYLALADAHAANGEVGAAITSARSAHAAAQRLNATILGDRSAAALRTLGATPPRSPAGPTLAGLTGRETDVLDGLRRGDSNAEIAARLYLSPKTVEHHVGRILAKLGVRTRAEAAALAATARATAVTGGE